MESSDIVFVASFNAPTIPIRETTAGIIVIITAANATNVAEKPSALA